MTDISSVQTPVWQGIHHVALVTPDLDTTIQFYRDVLGMQLLFVAPAGEMHGRHAAFLPGVGFLGLHFFEMPNAQIFGHPDLTEEMHWFPGALHHISFALPDERTALALQKRLQSQGIATTGVMDQGGIFNMVFQDNNGMLLEAAWSKEADAS